VNINKTPNNYSHLLITYFHRDFRGNVAFSSRGSIRTSYFFPYPYHFLEIMFNEDEINQLNKYRGSFTSFLFFLQSFKFFSAGISKSEQVQEIRINLKTRGGILAAVFMVIIVIMISIDNL